MAGQPQEPWQSYSPPAPPADDKDTYAFPQPGAQGFGQAQAQAHTQPQPQPGARPAQAWPASYPAQEQYTAQDQSPWQEAPAAGAPRVRAARSGGDTKGFFGALFDFGFHSFVTPKIIKALYVLYTIWMVVWAVIFLRLGFKYGGTAGGIFTLIVVVPIFLLLTLGACRVVLELFMVIHRIHDELRAIRERSDERG